MSDKVLMECKKCGSATHWDNRLTKRNPKAPSFKCTNRSCDGAIWDAPVTAVMKATPYQQQDRGALPNDDGPSVYAEPAAEPASGNKSTQLYLAAMKFVVNTVVPVWEAGQIAYTASDVNAATATIMIDHQRRSGR